MQTKIFVFIFCSILMGNTFSSELELLKAVQKINSIPKLIKNSLDVQNVDSCLVANYKSQICPDVLIEEILDNKKEGLVGAMNQVDHALTDANDFSTPDKICQSAPPNPTPLTRDLNLAFPEHTFNCRAELEKNNIKGIDLLRAEDYINSFLLEKKTQVESNMLSLLSVNHQIEQLIGPGKTPVSCHEFTNVKAYEVCKKLSSCTVPDASLFEQKLTTVFDSIDLIRRLRTEMRTSQHREDLRQAIDTLRDANPILKSSTFEPLFMNLNQPLKRTSVAEAYKHELNRTRDIAIVNLNKNNHAHLCMTGKKSDCEDFNEVVRTQFGQSKVNIKNLSDSYRCLENAKENRNEANKVLNDLALSAALSFTPMAALQLGKVLYQGGKLIKTASQLANVEKKIMIGTMAFDGAFAANEISKVQKSCEGKLKNLEEPSSEISCEQQKAQITLQVDAAECTAQILVAGISTLAPALGLLSLSTSKSIPTKLTSLLKSENDHELTNLLESFAKETPDVTLRQSKIKNLETKAASLLNASEGYSKEEVKYGLKVLIKRCLEKS